MLSFGGAGLEIAGGHVGLREAVLLLIVLLAFYIGRVLWRMRHIAAPPERTAQQASAPAPAAALSAMAEETAQPVRVEALNLVAGGASGPELAHMEREISLLREEVDILRSELAALRNDMQHDLAQVRVAQNVSPLYGDAMQMAVAGHSAEMIAERCGIARAEAELVVALTQSQAAAQHMQRGDEYGG